MNKYFIGLSITTAILLTGCGSSSDSSTVTTDTISTGYLVDTIVEGIDYETESGIIGTTNEFGEFKYKNNERIKFKIGNLILGDSDSKNIITPEDLTDNDINKTDLMLQMIQSIDEDNNLTNGIQVPEDIRASLNEKTEEIDFNKDIYSEEDLLKIDNKLSEKIDSNYDGHIDITVKEAKTHFEETIIKLKENENSVKKAFEDEFNKIKENYDENKTEENLPNLNDFTELYDLSIEEKDEIIYMWNEEKMARDIYLTLGEQFNSNVLLNIANRSESTHMDLMKDLIEKYTLNLIPDTIITKENEDILNELFPIGTFSLDTISSLYDTLIAQGTSLEESLKIGCIVEVTDVNDLDRTIEAAKENQAEDLVAYYETLRNGSYSHYWAFDKALKNIGVTEGCAVLGSEYTKTEEEYPTK